MTAAPVAIPSATAVKTLQVNGGSLFRIALDELGDALQWTRIAAANRLLDPILPPNTPLLLVIPPVNRAADSSGILKPNFGTPVFALGPASDATLPTPLVVQPPSLIPVNVAVPTIVGTPVVGQVLTASNGTWTNNPTSFAYKWLRGTLVIAVGQTYNIASADGGSQLTLSVVAANNSGRSMPALSAPSHVITSIITYDFTSAPESGIQSWLKAW